ncbi:MAG: sulfurtransferase [Rhodospirillales bacterium]|nr:sulfurtransferase [Rhodospirillales bacterium]
MDPVITTAELMPILGQPGLVVLEATKYLPGEPGNPAAEFAASRIPGARYFDVDLIADTDATLPHMLPAPGRFARLVGQLGISNDSDIVVYDRGPMFWASRVWWMFGAMGHDRVRVLDGGWTAWRAANGPVETGAPAAPRAASFVPSPRSVRVRGVGDLVANLATGQELVVDARGAARFHAQVPEFRPGLRSGHIPGAVNLPAATLVGPDKTMLPVADLKAKLAAAGIDGSRPVVASCGSGVSATLITLAMVRTGFAPGAVYDGSWTEWGGRQDLPLET